METPTDDPFDKVTIYMPKGMLQEVAKYKHRMKVEDQMTLSQMICLAVDNELQAANPFDAEIKIDFTEPQQQYAYADEAGRMLNFLRRFPKGTTLQTLFNCRWNYGIPDVNTVKRAWRELLATDTVEFFMAFRPFVHTAIRVKGTSVRELKKTKYRRIAGVSTKGLRLGEPDKP